MCAAHCLIPYRHSDGAFNLVGTETSCTNVYMARSTLDNRLDALDVGLPHSIGASVGVRDLDAERHTLAANITLSMTDSSFQPSADRNVPLIRLALLGTFSPKGRRLCRSPGKLAAPPLPPCALLTGHSDHSHSAGLNSYFSPKRRLCVARRADFPACMRGENDV